MIKVLKEMIPNFLFGLWLYFGLRSFDEAIVSAPNGQVLSVLFCFEKLKVDGDYISTGESHWTYASTGDISK